METLKHFLEILIKVLSNLVREFFKFLETHPVALGLTIGIIIGFIICIIL